MDLGSLTVGVTGAGGFIGERLLQLAGDTGADIVGLEVAPEAYRRARHTGAEVVEGDTRDAQAARRFAEQCDVVVHTAAIVGEGGSWEDYRSVNVQGTRTVGEQAARCGVELFVHLSSVMVYGFDFPPGIDESGPLRGEDNPYCQTKIESERVIRDLHDAGRLDVAVIRPGDVYGPRSQPWVVRPIELMKQHLFVLPDGGRGILDPTYVDNLLAGILLVVEREATGEPYNITDGTAVQARDFFAHHARMLERGDAPTLPGFALRPAFSAVERAFEATGTEPPARTAALDFLSKPGGFSTERIRELGYEPEIDLDEGMQHTERWAERVGLLT